MTDSDEALKPDSSVRPQSCGNAADGAVASGGLKAKLKTLWRWFNVVVDYIDDEDPNPPKKPGTPPLERADIAISESALKRCWNRINAFFDFLEEGVKEPKTKKTFGETLRGIREDCRSGTGRIRLLKSVGGFCWRVVYLGTILVFLFAAALLGTVKTMEYVAEHRKSFYPAPEIVQYLADEHEYLEEVADSKKPSPDAWPDVHSNDWDVTTLDKLKPIYFYRDDYGVYIVTSSDSYAGEHGIFIAFDSKNMPPQVSWGLIKGRVFTYVKFDTKPFYAL